MRHATSDAQIMVYLNKRTGKKNKREKTGAGEGGGLHIARIGKMGKKLRRARKSIAHERKKKEK